jgi:hypothetical protein
MWLSQTREKDVTVDMIRSDFSFYFKYEKSYEICVTVREA